MAEARFIQIHTLTSYPGALLNRDDAGFAKRLPFGGATRTRVSSQCLKYSWRNHNGEHALSSLDGVSRSIRSRETFKEKIARPMIEAGYPPALAACAVLTLRDLVLSDDMPKKERYQAILQGEEAWDAALGTSQVTILGEPEVNYLRQLAQETIDPLRADLKALWDDPEAKPSDEQTERICDALKNVSKGDLKKNLRGLTRATGLDAALFGRMATSDALARGDAAIHVAHAFTTHAEESESDYFSAVDELKAATSEGELGSGHINTSELNSGLFYGYVVADVPLLVSNLEGCKGCEWLQADRSLAADVIERLIHVICTVSPGAKLGSTAPYSWAECVFVECGSSQPRTLANAFRKSVEGAPDILAASYEALGTHVAELDGVYGVRTERRLSGVGPIKDLAEKLGLKDSTSLADTAQWAAAQVRG